MRKEEDWKALTDYVKTKFRRIDVLVNNAGIYLIKPVAETTVEELEEIPATNVRGVFLGMKHLAPLMAQRKRGSIINISSMDEECRFWTGMLHTAAARVRYER